MRRRRACSRGTVSRAAIDGMEWYVGGIAGVLAILDALTTHIGLKNGSAEETNPLWRHLYSRLPLPAFIALLAGGQFCLSMSLFHLHGQASATDASGSERHRARRTRSPTACSRRQWPAGSPRAAIRSTARPRRDFRLIVGRRTRRPGRSAVKFRSRRALSFG